METRLPLRWWPWWSATPARGGTRPHALELRGDLGWRQRAPAVVVLAVIAALHVVMGVALFEASSPGSERLAIADLGPWSRAPVPVRAAILLAEPAGLWLMRGDVRLHKPRLREGSRVPADVIELPFIQSLQMVNRIEIRDARFWLNMGREPRITAPASEISGLMPLLEPIARAAFNKLLVHDALLVTPRVGEGQQTLDKIDLTVRAVAGRNVSSVTGRFRHRGEMVAFESSLQPPAISSGKWRLPLRATAASRHAQLDFNGVVTFDAGRFGLTGQLEAKGTSLAAFASWLGNALPDGVGATPFSVEGAASWRDGVLSLEQARVMLDGQVAAGALSMSFNTARPFIDGALAFKKLDASALLRLVAGTRAGSEAVDGRQTPTLAGDARLALFDAIDADLRLSADEVPGLGVAVSRAALSVTARGGEIVADLAELDFAGGSATGQVRLDQRRDTVALQARGSLHRGDSNRMLSLVPQLEPAFRASGLVNVRFEAASRGRSRDALMRALTGEASIGMPYGGHLPLDIPDLMATARERRVLAFSEHRTKSVPFETFDARFAVRYGRLVSEYIALRSGGATIIGDGTAATDVGQIYLRLLAEHGQGLARTARLGRFQSVLVYGDLANPTVRAEEPVGVPPSATAAPVVFQPPLARP